MFNSDRDEPSQKNPRQIEKWRGRMLGSSLLNDDLLRRFPLFRASGIFATGRLILPHVIAASGTVTSASSALHLMTRRYVDLQKLFRASASPLTSFIWV